MSRIAIVGSGISGLVCAHRLSSQHEVTLFESNNYLGGHTATVDVQIEEETYAIDTGFIVFNDRTYPKFQALLAELNVRYQSTEMSFSVNNPNENLIYNGNSINSLFCQRKNMISPRFLGFVKEILRFNNACKARYAANDFADKLNLGEYLTQQQHSRFFAQNYILPMGAAIWSSSLTSIEKFPLQFFVNFFYNHGLLDVTNRPQWFTVLGGSRTYVEALLNRSNAEIHLNTPVQRIRKLKKGISISTPTGEQEFDEVILACHSDQALALLEDPTPADQEVLGAIPYRDNEVVLHNDTTLLPPISSARASWNYHCSTDSDVPAAVTYSMNILQQLPKGSPIFNVTLNNTQAIAEDKIIQRFSYSHPVFNTDLVAAQTQRGRICGVDHIHYCGAYWYNGFHEDGIRSADDICERLQ